MHANGPPGSDGKAIIVPTSPQTQPKPAPQDRKPSVTVTYNGVDRELSYAPNATVNSLLQHALNEFNVQENRHTMALVTTGGVELELNAHLEAVLKPGDLLVLRPSTVRGGGHC